jgi:glycosyltransferase involved in cell wall biosynthesis
LSIIIAVKFFGDEINATLSSLLLLPKTLVEVIVVNGSGRRILMYEELLPEQQSMYILQGPDKNIYDAWNKGLAVARGEYVAFIGSGDLVRKDYFSRMHESALKTGADLILCKQMQWLEDRKPLRELGRPWVWKEFQKKFSIPHIGCWHKRALFLQYGGFDDSFFVAGDYEWLLRVGKNIQSAFVDEVLVDVTVGGISDNGNRVFMESKRARKMHTDASEVDLFIRDYVYRVRKKVRKLLWG